MASDTLAWLQHWYRSKCDGDWEHDRGVRIDTIDNPGWSVVADVGTIEIPEQVTLERSDHDWMKCEVKQERFYGYGGPGNLEEMLECLRSWIDH